MLGPEPGHTQTPCSGNGHRPSPRAQTPGSGQGMGTPPPPPPDTACWALPWLESQLLRQVAGLGGASVPASGRWM